VYRTVRKNLRQVTGCDVDDGALYRVFCHAGRTYYEFFRALGQPAHTIAQSIHISAASQDLIRSEVARGQGVLLLGVHMSNLNLALLALGGYDLPAQVLSLDAPIGGFGLLDSLRRDAGLDVTPVSPRSLRVAIRRLRSGGLVVTGADRPVPGDGPLVEFFGQPACLPLGPARLALMTGAAVMVGACHHSPERGYVLEFTDPIDVVRTGDREADIVGSARRIAEAMESFVRAYPEQWMMFHRVWPEPSGEEAV
jgi:KDO2-lipid IV(A) lauroyltransferase